MDKEDLKERRRVEIRSDQFYLEGWFCGWSTIDGMLFAVVESDSGEVSSYKQPGYYSIKFKA